MSYVYECILTWRVNLRFLLLRNSSRRLERCTGTDDGGSSTREVAVLTGAGLEGAANKGADVTGIWRDWGRGRKGSTGAEFAEGAIMPLAGPDKEGREASDCK